LPQIEPTQKITVHVPAHLLEDAQKITGSGITQTITTALEKLATSIAYQKFVDLRGSCQLDVDLNILREDRGFE